MLSVPLVRTLWVGIFYVYVSWICTAIPPGFSPPQIERPSWCLFRLNLLEMECFNPRSLFSILFRDKAASAAAGESPKTGNKVDRSQSLKDQKGVRRASDQPAEKEKLNPFV